jgi:hypothetical protein
VRRVTQKYYRQSVPYLLLEPMDQRLYTVSYVREFHVCLLSPSEYVSMENPALLWVSTVPVCGAKLMRSDRHHPRRVRVGVLLLVFFSVGMTTGAQEALPPALEAKIAAAVHELKSGNLDSAENTFSNVLRQGIKHPLIYHNLGVIAMLRGKRHAISSSACSSTGLWFLPLTPRY